MHAVVDVIVDIVKFFYFLVAGTIRACLPAQWIGLKDVRGQTVLITGGAMGMGKMMALRFADLGCNIVLWDINKAVLEETAKEVRERGATVSAYTVDLSQCEDIYKVADKVKAKVGDVDILINNAGIVSAKNLLDTEDHLITRTMDVNVNAHFWTIKAFLPAMLTKNRGHVVSLASSAGYFGVTKLVDYCTSKFAARGLQEALDLEVTTLGYDGIHFTTVCPFFINTGMFDGVKKEFHSLAMLEPEYAVDKIMEAILTNQTTLIMPRMLYLLNYVSSFMPVKCYKILMRITGVDRAMDTYVGHQKKAY